MWRFQWYVYDFFEFGFALRCKIIYVKICISVETLNNFIILLFKLVLLDMLCFSVIGIQFCWETNEYNVVCVSRRRLNG